MNKLRQHINSLSIDEQNEFANSCGTSISYIRKILSSNGKLFFGPAICRRIEENTSSLVTRKDLRPNDWREIWPELAQQVKSDKAA
jgi:hypothetical protein